MLQVVRQPFFVRSFGFVSILSYLVLHFVQSAYVLIDAFSQEHVLVYRSLPSSVRTIERLHNNFDKCRHPVVIHQYNMLHTMYKLVAE